MSGLPTNLRPHAKIHKSPVLAQMQTRRRRTGFTTATVWEAGAMIDAGLNDLLIANQSIGEIEAAAAARAAGSGRITLAVESETNLRELSDAARAAKSDIGVIIEVETDSTGAVSLTAGARRTGGADRQAAWRDASGRAGLRGTLHARARSTASDRESPGGQPMC